MKHSNWSLFFSTAMLFWLAFSACETNVKTDKNTTDDVGAADMNDTLNNELADEKTELRRDIDEAQSDIDRRIDKLQVDMADAKTEAKADMQRQIDALKVKKTQLAADLERLDQNIESEWETFKGNVRQTIKDIGDDNPDQR